MPVGMRVELLDDDIFSTIRPDLRWFYAALCLEMLGTTSTARRLTMDRIQHLTGFDRAAIKVAIEELKGFGLFDTGAGGELLIPRAMNHFDDCQTGTKKERKASKPTKPRDEQEDAVNEVFAYWKEVFKEHNAKGVRLTKGRATKIAARLRDGHTIEELKSAIVGASITPFNMGDNDRGAYYNDLELLCRNSEKVNQYAGYAKAYKRKQELEKGNTVDLTDRKKVIETARAQEADDLFLDL